MVKTEKRPSFQFSCEVITTNLLREGTQVVKVFKKYFKY